MGENKQMKRLLVWFALIALACAGAVSASTYVGYSNAFGIDNTKGSTRPAPPAAVGVSPYDNGAPYNLVRTELHAHAICDRVPGTSRPLGSDISSETLAQRYWDAGYRGLAQTNHGNLSGGALGSGAPSIIWLPRSAELSLDGTNYVHVLAIGTDTTDITALEGNSRSEGEIQSIETRVANTKAHGGLALIAHPDSRPYAINANNLNKVIDDAAPNAVGVYTPGNNSEGMWNAALKSGRRIWGYAEEDYHDQMNSRNIGQAWVAVPGYESDPWTSVRSELAGGNYYIYWMTDGKWDYASDNQPPRLKVTVDNSGQYPVITASMQDWSDAPFAPQKIEFLRADGRALSGVTGSGSTYSYACKGWEQFVRVRVHHKVRSGVAFTACSQPIRANPQDAATGALARVQSTSPELRLRYLSDEERPATMPSAGYIGFAFDVTTDSGTVPSGATL